MNYKIIGLVMPMLEFELAQGKRLYAQTGAMQWMSNSVKMETEMKGGFLGAIKRSVSGEDMFIQ